MPLHVTSLPFVVARCTTRANPRRTSKASHTPEDRYLARSGAGALVRYQPHLRTAFAPWPYASAADVRPAAGMMSA